MAILEMQGMQPTRGGGNGGGCGCGGSDVSFILCDSNASLLVCL
jgi:hypothetical protein